MGKITYPILFCIFGIFCLFFAKYEKSKDRYRHEKGLKKVIMMTLYRSILTELNGSGGASQFDLMPFIFPAAKKVCGEESHESRGYKLLENKFFYFNNDISLWREMLKNLNGGIPLDDHSKSKGIAIYMYEIETREYYYLTFCGVFQSCRNIVLSRHSTYLGLVPLQKND